MQKKQLCVLRYSSGRVGFWLCILMTIMALSGWWSVPVFADSAPGGNISDPVVRAVDTAKPAVVRILTTVKARLTVHLNTQVTFPQNDNKYPITFSGTGTFVSAQGDILTADHVVSPPKDKTLDQALYSLAAADIADYQNKNGQQTTHDEVLAKLNSGELQTDKVYDKPGSVVYLSTDYTGPLEATDFKNLPTGTSWMVDQVKKESPPDQMDLAIVHVPMQDSPVIELHDSSNVHQQDNLTIIGFPGNADVSYKPNDFLTSSVNTISVSSIKSSSNGSPLIQVAGNVEHGDSGGPALDSQGKIVGIVSFRLADANGNESTGTSFLQASNSARDMITGLGLDTTPGPFQKLWSQGIQDYADTSAGHWHKALDSFNQLSQNYLPFKAVRPYLQYTQTQAQGEKVTPTASATVVATATAQPTRPARPSTGVQPAAFPLALALTIGGVVLLMLLVGLLGFVMLRPKKQKQPSTIAPTSPSDQPADQPVDTVSATGKPANPPLPRPVSSAGHQPGTQDTLALKIWPCGHMNRPGARFCSICGEAAPLNSSPDH